MNHVRARVADIDLEVELVERHRCCGIHSQQRPVFGARRAPALPRAGEHDAAMRALASVGLTASPPNPPQGSIGRSAPAGRRPCAPPRPERLVVREGMFARRSRTRSGCSGSCASCSGPPARPLSWRRLARPRARVRRPVVVPRERAARPRRGAGRVHRGRDCVAPPGRRSRMPSESRRRPLGAAGEDVEALRSSAAPATASIGRPAESGAP